MAKRTDVTAIGGEAPTNGAEDIISLSQPYHVTAKIKGSSDFLFHRWNCEAVAEKAAAAKGSKAKKTDDIESYVYRNPNGELCIPGEYFRQSVVMAAKFRQDPRSPRKSAFDLFKAAVCTTSDLCSVGKTDWDYLDKRRVAINKSGITRCRPALLTGWECHVSFVVLLPEYVPSEVLNDVLVNAGRLIGVGDFRPTFGRYQVIEFNVGLD